MPARLGNAGVGLRGFIAWWSAGLRAWLPLRWQHLLSANGDRVLLQVQGDGVQLRRQRADSVQDVAMLPLQVHGAADGRDPLAGVLADAAAELPRWLVLPASQGLRRPLLLPAAARERLRDMLAFEIERQTPFAAADVVHDGRLLGVREDGQLQVELVVVPRRALDAQMTQLGAMTATLAGVDLLDAEGRTLGVNLLPPAQRLQERNPWRVWNLILGAVALLALGLALAQVVDNRRAAADALQAEVASRSTQARAVAEQRQRLVDAVEGGAYLQRQRNGRASVIEVIDALSPRLPDGTYLEKLSIEGEQLTLLGLSNQAAALVGKLEGAPQWDLPALSGALQTDPRTRMDRFTIVAQLRGTAAEKSTDKQGAAGGAR
ncbi:PilN domain-containing protein [Thermomonas carbonis]|uniref:PilN domain-containing protein n=1 Tax=Thermomonas carbonis TaxID=1463158 RepID=A0A7G9SUB1_9GAMM|nr:PilN domain-containing protein [Thermomonas carbonis]QNN71436.1 PilN domain-containing protein [Thermomonas carbonis]GHC09593.1 type II secretion system protein L [Thermomonas carbonis]